MFKIAKKRKKPNKLKLSETRKIDGKIYGCNTGFTRKSLANKHAKVERKSGKFSSVRVKPITLASGSGKNKQKFHVVYLRKK